MRESSKADWDRAVDEAADWRVKLADDPDNPDLIRQFGAWRAASTLNAELWEKAVRAYDLAGAMPRKLETSGHRPPARIAPDRPVGRKRLWPLAAMAAIAACLLFLLGPVAVLWLQADYLTETAEHRTIILEDGTRVQLGPASAIAVDFSSARRIVTLLKGEAFFDVVSNPERPFRVAAGYVAATVLGTSFEVRMGGTGVSVAVREGRVRVEGEGIARPADLLAGEWISVRGAAVEQGTRDPGEIGTWLDGEFVARNRPLMEIVEALRRSYPGMIVVRDDALAQLRVTGVYDLRQPETTLANLAFSHEVQFRNLSPWLMIVTAK